MSAWLVKGFACLLMLIGVVLGVGGAWLLALGGSGYYFVAGLGLAASAIALLLASPWGVWLYLIVYAFTWVWALMEVGFDGWSLVPRVVAPTVLAVAALL